MTDRERFRQTMRFGATDRPPLWECAFWGDTYARWSKEGLPEAVMHPEGRPAPTEASLCAYFGFDRSFGIHFRQTLPIHINLYPPFEREKLAEENGIITERVGDGSVVRYAPHAHSTRQFVSFPVNSPEDFKAILPRLQSDTPGRFPPGWLEKAKTRQETGAPVCLSVGGYYGFARSLMGLENLSCSLYDQPELVEAIFTHRTEYICRIIEHVLEFVTPDFAEFWEDMAFKTGPLISPVLYRRLALRHYRQVTDLLRRHGVDIILLDSDGCVDELIPVWLDGGVTCLWPLEIAAGMDPVALRKKYGRSLGLIGGIDKRALAAGREAIRQEVMAKVPFLLGTGGFIPTCDHAVPPDVSLQDYQYYLSLISELYGMKGACS